jgi:hypothetical protein
MGYLSSPPIFLPPQPPLVVGSVNDVLEVISTNKLGFAAAGGGITTGSFTITLPAGGGFASTVTGTMDYYIIGSAAAGIVILFCENTISGTSNLDAFTVTGMPAAILPTNSYYAPSLTFLDNANNTMGAIAVTASSPWFVNVSCSNGNSSGNTFRMILSEVEWTASGSKGFGAGFSTWYPIP